MKIRKEVLIKDIVFLEDWKNVNTSATSKLISNLLFQMLKILKYDGDFYQCTLLAFNTEVTKES